MGDWRDPQIGRGLIGDDQARDGIGLLFNTGADADSPGARAQLLLRQAGATRLTCGLSELTRLPEMAPQALRQA